ncbi:hypothetical protein SynBIOSE41_03783 [Synechococcus sp. BIOS-E4-1]|nr:hypothetical protein SynBIOSE41_03783 [Synechococcus sp. BIOS-E4-1]
MESIRGRQLQQGYSAKTNSPENGEGFVPWSLGVASFCLS